MPFKLPSKTVEIAASACRANAGRHEHRSTTEFARLVELAAVCMDPGEQHRVEEAPAFVAVAHSQRPLREPLGGLRLAECTQSVSELGRQVRVVEVLEPRR